MSFRLNVLSGSKRLIIEQPVLCRLAKLAVTQDDLLRSKLAEVTFNRVRRSSVWGAAQLSLGCNVAQYGVRRSLV